MFPRILVPLDGSEFAEDALPMARRLATDLGAELHLVHVLHGAPDVDLKNPQEDMDWKATLREGANDYLTSLAEEIREDGVSCETDVVEGQVVKALDEYVKSRRISLVAMTTHGSGGLKRWWLGSVADGLLHRGSSHILLVRPWDETEDRPVSGPRFRKILVPLDGTEEAEAAVDPARELAEELGSSLSLLTVVASPLELTSIYGVPGVRVGEEGAKDRREQIRTYLQGVAGRLGDPAPEALVVENQNAAEGVIAGAREAEADLIVLSSHGRAGFERAVIGSVADKVIRGITLPVLVIRHPAER